jgi:hypothetical protein
MVFKPIGSTSYDEVKTLHRDSDVDESPIAQHHTLGILPNQASPGDHVHDGKSSKKIEVKDLVGVSITYTPAGGTVGGTQPTFTGNPLFTGSHTRIGNLCFFQIDVAFTNILTFGTGQYYVNLPFNAEHFIAQRNGILTDFSTSKKYQISGIVQAGSSQLMLYTQTSNGLDTAFEHNVPHQLAVEDSFHIAGTYEIMV